MLPPLYILCSVSDYSFGLQVLQNQQNMIIVYASSKPGVGASSKAWLVIINVNHNFPFLGSNTASKKVQEIIDCPQRTRFLITFKLKKYDRSDSFPFDYEPNGRTFVSQSKEQLSLRSYSFQF